ncbi:multiple sugar transport system permease protein [Lachnospiraceae bacterium PF1-21]
MSKKIKKKATKREKKDWLVAYLFILPLLAGILLFYVYPFIQNIWFSFNDVNKFNVATFTGFDNYIKMFQDKAVWQSLGNTFKYVLIVVPVSICLSLFIAALLNTKIKGKSIYRTIYFLPSVTMAAAVALVWKWIFNGQSGVLNAILRVFGLPAREWLQDPKTSLYCIMVVGIWMVVGYNMIILLAGLQGVSKSYYEAAAIDGAGPVKQFFAITIPLLSPTIFFVLITSIISGFQVFDTVYMMVGKGSMAFESTQTVVMLFYRNAFDYGQKGYAAAISVLIFVVILIITAIQMIGQKKWVNYD